MLSELDPYSVISVQAHDLATPLTTIVGAADYLSLQVGQSKIPDIKWVQMIQEESKKMSRLLHELLLYSALENKKVRYTFASVDLVPFIQNLKDHLDKLFGSSISVTVDVKESSLPTVADPDKLIDACAHLVRALIPKRHPQATIGIALRKKQSQAIITVNVSDPNMTTVPNPKTPTPTPLGVYLCARVVKDHKGSVTIEQKKNNAASAHIVLTVVKQKGGYV